MRRAILIGMLCLLPVSVFAWDDRDYYNLERDYQLERIADELRYQREYREYQDQVEAYEEANPEPIQQFMLQHYHKWPTPPKR